MHASRTVRHLVHRFASAPLDANAVAQLLRPNTSIVVHECMVHPLFLRIFYDSAPVAAVLTATRVRREEDLAPCAPTLNALWCDFGHSWFSILGQTLLAANDPSALRAFLEDPDTADALEQWYRRPPPVAEAMSTPTHALRRQWHRHRAHTAHTDVASWIEWGLQTFYSPPWVAGSATLLHDLTSVQGPACHTLADLHAAIPPASTLASCLRHHAAYFQWHAHTPVSTVTDDSAAYHGDQQDYEAAPVQGALRWERTPHGDTLLVATAQLLVARCGCPAARASLHEALVSFEAVLRILARLTPNAGADAVLVPAFARQNRDGATVWELVQALDPDVAHTVCRVVHETLAMERLPALSALWQQHCPPAPGPGFPFRGGH